MVEEGLGGDREAAGFEADMCWNALVTHQNNVYLPECSGHTGKLWNIAHQSIRYLFLFLIEDQKQENRRWCCVSSNGSSEAEAAYQ